MQKEGIMGRIELKKQMVRFYYPSTRNKLGIN
mgnify:CR=1 FL=1